MFSNPKSYDKNSLNQKLKKSLKYEKIKLWKGKR
ncbi:MAG: hypothetical protein PWP26_480 [Thermodesulfobacterium sp.]|jgi:hypothetical protein|nr:hypothetical protein [Thermodesulfobacterium sp.]